MFFCEYYTKYEKLIENLKEIDIKQVDNDLFKFKGGDYFMNLFAFPYAFGGANIYKQIEKFLDNNINLIAVNYPGHETEYNRQPCKSIQDIANDIYNRIKDKLDEEYMFLGYSMGGLISYELYQIIRKNNKKLPRHIFLFASNEPNYPHEKKDYENFDINQIKEELIELNGTNNEVISNDEIIEFLSPIIKSDLIAISNYEPTIEVNSKVKSPVTIVRGENEQDIIDCEQGWNKYLSNECEYIMVKGDHFFLFNEEINLIQQYVDIINERSK